MEEKLLPGQWPKEKAWQWYNSRKWMRGCNYLQADCIDPFEQWQEFEFDEKLKTAEKELDWAASIGFNALRVRVPFEVWVKEKDGLINRFERFLKISDKRGIGIMPRFGQDCLVPKEEYVPFVPGPQRKVEWGYHGGYQRDPWRKGNIGWSPLEEKENEKDFYDFLEAMVKAFGKDNRVIMWEIWNEPGNSGRDNMSADYIRKSFEIIRKLSPIQPLTCNGGWSFKPDNPDPLSTIRQIEIMSMELSDIINFHHYGQPWETANIIHCLKKKYERPIIITEWLHRINNNNFQNILPLLYMERIGSFSYGLVAGKAQFYEPWEGMRDKPGLDMRLWQHDIFKSNGRPYDPEEIKVIKKLGDYADAQDD
jgi:hypothetical protein